MSIAPSPELTVLGLAAVLQGIQLGLAGYAASRDAGLDWNLGPRDSAQTFSPLTGRLRRAVSNHFEALAFFTIAVVLVQFTQSNSTLTAVAAWVYLAARVLFIPAYAFAWSPWRSAIYIVGFLASMVMIAVSLL